MFKLNMLMPILIVTALYQAVSLAALLPAVQVLDSSLPVVWWLILMLIFIGAIAVTAVTVRRLNLDFVRINTDYVARIEADLDRKQREIDELRQRLRSSEIQIAELRTELHAYQQDRSRLELALEQAGETISIKDELILDLKHQLDDKKI